MSLRPRGNTLLFVLMVLLVTTIAATAYFSVTARAQLSSTAVLAQQIAASRAELGAQQAIRDIRSGNVVVNVLSPRGAVPDGIAGCGGLNCITRGPVDNGATQDLATGGGLQYEYIVVKVNEFGTQANRYTIQSTGYYGYTPASTNFTWARTEVEIDVGSSNTWSPTGYQGNSGQL